MIEMNQLLKIIVDNDASDLHVAVGKPPTMRISGRLETIDLEDLTADDTQRLMEEITPTRHQQAIQEMGSADFGYTFSDMARFRVSAFRAHGNIGVVCRLIPSRFLTWEELGLNEYESAIKELCHRPRGIFLVVGPTGSGKTTTLATFIDYINAERDAHIITCEDPIEYFHKHKKGIVTHRELNVDTPSFSSALRAALRQDPDVILVGEMRDLETMEAAITAAETGHLVFATLHTNSASQTVERIIDSFPTQQQEQIRMQLSISLICVISQQLLQRADGRGRLAGFEIMINTPAIANLIRERKTNRILSSIQTGTKLSMVSMDMFLQKAYSKGLITAEMAIERAHDQPDMRAKIM
jgi:twitching motility protein PilT